MAEEVKAIKHEDGTIEVDGKKFISKESHDVIAEKQREATDKLKKLEDKAAADKAEAEKKAAEEQGKWKELAEAKEKELADMKTQRVADAKRNAIKDAASKLGAQNADTVSKLIDSEKIEVGEDGAVKAESVTALLEGLKTEQPYLFGASQQQQNAGNAGGGAPAGGSGGGTQTFYRSQLQSSKFYSDNRDAILAAERAGAIVDDINGAKKG